MDLVTSVKQKQCGTEFSFLGGFITFISMMYDTFFNYIFSFINSFKKVKKIPPPSDPLLKESVISLAQKIRNREVSSEKVVKIYIQRIKEINGILNAVVHDRFEEAIKEAKAADELIKSGSVSDEELKSTKSLFGVPFTSKESISAKGMSWTRGLICRRDKIGIEDAEVIKCLKNNGAILIAVTNIPEFCMWVETRNNVYGQTNNPYNTNRSVGGSSGGEACIVTSCGSPFGLATDLGGSIRIPAYFCGVYGHKLTGGLIKTRGMLFRTGEEPFTIVSAGTITRYAKDLKMTSSALVIPEKLPLLKFNIEVDIKSLKFYYVLNPGDVRVSAIDLRIEKALLNVVRLIKESNVNELSPQEVHFPGFRYCFLLWIHVVSKEKLDLSQLLADSKGNVNVFVEICKTLFQCSSYTFSAILNLLNAYLPLPNSSWAEEELKNLKTELLEKLGEDGVLLFPSYPTVAPYHYQQYLRPFNFAYMSIFNALQLPVTQIPIGLSDDGMPLGIQIVAGPYKDKLCFAVAEYIESLIGGWVPPFSSYV